MKNLRSMSTMMVMGAMVAAHADVTQINAARVFERVFNDVPTSNFVQIVDFPNSVFMADNNVGGETGWANRHIWRLAVNDGVNTNAYELSGGEDTFEFKVKMKLEDGNGTSPRRSEAGLFFNFPIDGGWISEVQYIITPDGEVAAFGTPIPFYSFTAQQGVSYQLGSTVTMGARYFKDTDNQYKWVWIYNDLESFPLTLENVVPLYDFGTNGLKAGSRLGAYLQIVRPNPGASMTATDIEINPYPAVKGTALLGDLPGLAGEQVTVEVRNPGSTTALQTTTATLKANGSYAFKPTVAPGVYDIALKGTTHLRKVVANVNIAASGASGVNISARNGDVDGDNTVTIFDYIDLSNSFDLAEGDSGYNADADLDRDGSITIFDYIILSNNFDESGDN